MDPVSEFFLPPTNPRIRILSYQDYLEEVKAALVEVLSNNDIQKERYTIRSGEPFPVNDDHGGDPLVVPLFLTIDAWQSARDLGTMITLGRAILDIVKYLRTRRDQKEVQRYTINCSSTYYMAVDFLRTQGIAIGRPMYFHSFGYQCLMISSDSKNSNAAHVVIFSNEGELIDYVALSL